MYNRTKGCLIQNNGKCSCFIKQRVFFKQVRGCLLEDMHMFTRVFEVSLYAVRTFGMCVQKITLVPRSEDGGEGETTIFRRLLSYHKGKKPWGRVCIGFLKTVNSRHWEMICILTTPHTHNSHQLQVFYCGFSSIAMVCLTPVYQNARAQLLFSTQIKNITSYGKPALWKESKKIVGTERKLVLISYEGIDFWYISLSVYFKKLGTRTDLYGIIFITRRFSSRLGRQVSLLGLHTSSHLRRNLFSSCTTTDSA